MSVDQESLIVNEKIIHDKTYSFPKGNYIFHLKMPSTFALPKNVKDQTDRRLIEVSIQEKQGTSFLQLIHTKILLKTGVDANVVSSVGDKLIDLQIEIKDI